MFYETDRNDHGLRYNPFKALVVPRPIGWISTVGRNGVGNLSPFSFFNALSYNPPFVMFSAGCRDDGTPKDSSRNAEETGDFVVNMATWDLREKMNDTSWIVERDVDEMLKVGLTPVPSRLVKAPRVAESPVHFECVYHQTVILPGFTPSSVNHVIIGKVVAVHVKDEFIDDRGLVDVVKLKPIARLGYMDYTTVESVFAMKKSTREDKVTARGPRQAAE